MSEYTSIAMQLKLKPATLIKRYKRFLADITLPDNSMTTIHCANTGAMQGCAEPDDNVWYSVSDNPKRKYAFSWEITQTKQQHYICVNTQRANQLVAEALKDNVVTELSGFNELTPEVKYGNENSRIDFLLKYDKTPDTYVEVKSVTLLANEHGYFPDAVTTRGQKHLRELIEMKANGHRAVLFFAVLHSGIDSVSAATHIDQKYSTTLQEAIIHGVEIIIYKAEFINKTGDFSIRLKNKVPFVTR